MVGAANRYIDEQAPWKLRKTDPERMSTVLYTLMETIRYLAILMQPIVPKSAGRMLDQLGVETSTRNFSFLTAAHRLLPRTKLAKPAPIFPRYVETK